MKIINKSTYDDAIFFEQEKIRPIARVGNKSLLLFVGISDQDPLVCRLTTENKNSLFAVPFDSFVAHSQESVTLETEDEEFLALIQSTNTLDMDKIL